jgi:DNA-binding MarR family transcriptional regulator
MVMTKRLLAELKQTKPHRTLEEEVFINLQFTADALMRATANLLKQHGISPAQYNVLRILRGAGKTGLSCREIGSRMITRDPDVTRLLDRLEKRELLIRSREDKDRRVIIVRITQAGLVLLAELDNPIEQLHISLLGHVKRKKLETLTHLLDMARSASM